MLIRNSGIFLPKEHPKYEIIKKDLTVKIQQFNSDEYQTLYFYEEMNGGILIPRYYHINEKIKDESFEGIDIEINSNIQLRNDTQNKVVDYLMNNQHGIIKALPGIGKTVCTIEYLSRRKKKTLIIIHKKDLLKQWITEIIKFTNLKEDDIGILTTQSKKYKNVLNKKIILTTPHVIGLALKKEKYEFLEELKTCGIGVLICDEIHSVVGAETFSKSCIVINSKYNFGLSATPERGEATNKIINYHFGDIKEFDVLKEDTIIPNIFVIKKNFEINSSNPKYINFGGRFDLNKYSNQSKKSKKYISLILSLINKCYDEKRNTIIVGNYIKVLLMFAELCKAPKEDIGIFLPTANKKDILKVSDITDMREAFLTKQLVFGSYQAVRDGNNRPNLDAAIMILPTNNPLQLVGRLTRKVENKKTPIAFDIVDTDPTIRKIWNSEKTEKIQKFEKALEDRMLVYKKQEWPVKILNK